MFDSITKTFIVKGLTDASIEALTGLDNRHFFISTTGVFYYVDATGVPVSISSLLTGINSTMVFATDTDMAPATPGLVLRAEFLAWLVAFPQSEVIVYYNGGDDPNQPPTYAWYVDANERILDLMFPDTNLGNSDLLLDSNRTVTGDGNSLDFVMDSGGTSANFGWSTGGILTSTTSFGTSTSTLSQAGAQNNIQTVDSGNNETHSIKTEDNLLQLKSSDSVSGAFTTFLMTPTVLEMKFHANSDWRINTDPGTLDQYIGSNGPNLAPTWKSIMSSVTADEGLSIESNNVRLGHASTGSGVSDFTANRYLYTGAFDLETRGAGGFTYFDGSTGRLGVGTDTPTTTVDIYHANEAYVTVEGDNNARLLVSSHNTNPDASVSVVSSLGTKAVKTAITSAKSLGAFQFNTTYDTSNTFTTAAITALASEDHSVTAMGTILRLKTIANGTTSNDTRMEINGDGEINFQVDNGTKVMQSDWTKNGKTESYEAVAGGSKTLYSATTFTILLQSTDPTSTWNNNITVGTGGVLTFAQNLATNAQSAINCFSTLNQLKSTDATGALISETQIAPTYTKFQVTDGTDTTDLTVEKTFVSHDTSIRRTGWTTENSIVDLNDWAPTDLKKSYVIDFATTADVDISGLDATDAVQGTEIRIINSGANNINLLHQDALSLAANRFSGPNEADLIIRKSGSVVLMYTGATRGWQVTGI